jgi:hypothetical protein
VGPFGYSSDKSQMRKTVITFDTCAVSFSCSFIKLCEVHNASGVSTTRAGQVFEAVRTDYDFQSERKNLITPQLSLGNAVTNSLFYG